MSSKKVCLITGVSREMGLGFEIAKQLKDLGFTVVITARDAKAVGSLAEKIGVESMSLDISSDDSVQKAASEFAKKFQSLDVLINNAGAFYDQGGKILSTETKFFQDALNTNLLGAIRMVKAFYPFLDKSESGRIVNVSSGAGSFQDPIFGIPVNQGLVPAYAISKLALNGFTVKLAKEVSHTKIKVNSVCPGFVATYPGTEEWGARKVSEGAKGIVWAATLDANGPSGGFFRDGKPIEW